jgi:hypothetical protein
VSGPWVSIRGPLTGVPAGRGGRAGGSLFDCKVSLVFAAGYRMTICSAGALSVSKFEGRRWGCLLIELSRVGSACCQRASPRDPGGRSGQAAFMCCPC